RSAQAFVRALGARVSSGALHVRGVATSEETAEIARDVDIPLLTLAEVDALDVTVDGADEVDPKLNLIKGYGRSMVREKIVAAASRHLVILIGPEAVKEKVVPVLGTRGKLPVEVLAFGVAVCRGKLEEMGMRATGATRDDGEVWLSEDGNPILDCWVGPIPNPAELEGRIRAIPGVVGTGLFAGMADAVLIQDGDELEVRQKPVVG